MTVDEALRIQQVLVNAYESSDFYDKPMYSQIFEAEKVSIEALEKHVPKKKATPVNSLYVFECPNCRWKFDDNYNYCPECGQRLER